MVRMYLVYGLNFNNNAIVGIIFVRVCLDEGFCGGTAGDDLFIF